MATNAPAPAYPIHIHARPSAAVEDAAIRLIRAGWLGIVKLINGRYMVPSETFPGAHSVEMADPEHMGCSCKGGARQLHCKHLAVIQFLHGWSAEWAPAPAIRPVTAQESNGGAETPPAPSSIDTEPIAVDENMYSLPGTAFGVTKVTWELVLAHANHDASEASRIVLSQLRKTVALNSGHCSCCGKDLEDVGTRSAICRQCGLVTPRKEAQRAA